MPYDAEIRTSRVGFEGASATEAIPIRHHRAGTAELAFEKPTGGHLLHLALAGCVFNNVIRLAEERGIHVDDAAVDVEGDFTSDGASTGMNVVIKVISDASGDRLKELRRDAFENSTVVHVLRKAAPVELKES